MISYSKDLNELEKIKMEGFFVGWPNPPSVQTFKKILRGSYRVVLATENEKLVGFINAISDGVLSAYIPLLEVLPEYKGQGIGKELVHHLRNELINLYMVDLSCDEVLIPYYEKQGMKRSQGAYLRNYDRQSGV